MEASGITTAKKSSASSQQCESDADLLFYSRGIVHHEYAPEGQTINEEYYLQVLRRLREAGEESGPTCGQQRIFSSTMTMPPLILHM